MEAFAKNVRAMLDSMGMTQQQFADEIGVTLTTVNGWLRRGVQPRAENLISISKRFGVSQDDILSGTAGYYAKKYNLVGAPANAIAAVADDDAYVQVRVIGSVHAGEPDEGFPEDGEVPLLKSLRDRHPRCYAVVSRGNCMDLVFGSGSVLFADPDMEPVDGSIGVFLVDGEAVVRRLRVGSSTVMLSPESSEAGHRDIIVPADGSVQMECQGVVFWYQAYREMS